MVISALSGVSAGIVLKWIIAIVGIIAVIVATSIKGYKMFEKFRHHRNHKESEAQTIENSKNKIDDLEKKYIELAESIEKNRQESQEIDKIKLRHTLVKDCEEAIERGYISFENLKSLEDLYYAYHEILNGNYYVTDLMKMVRKLPVVKREYE